MIRIVACCALAFMIVVVTAGCGHEAATIMSPPPPTSTPEHMAKPAPVAAPAGQGVGAAPVAPVVATRTFVGPNDFPPIYHHAAYGMVAFTSLANSASVARYRMICEAYVATLPPADSVDVPPGDQMVTVWPLNSFNLAKELNRDFYTSKVCGAAVGHYDLNTALKALKAAGLARGRAVNRAGRGPYLLAWAPSEEVGKPDVLVLVANLSWVATQADADKALRGWGEKIEGDPKLWRGGWDITAVLGQVRTWVDEKGGPILAVLDVYKKKGA